MPPETDNPHLEKLFREDQKDRETVYETAEAVAELKSRDRARRKRVYVMMDLGEVRAKNDLYHAAVVLHHGEEPADFLTGHRFATMAALMGHRAARFLLAATLDRFLMSAGLPQLYGTQFDYSPGSRRYEFKLPVYEHVLLDFEKEFLGVPSVGDRLRELNDKIRK